MKKIKKYITLAIFLSFAFISKVNAADVNNINVKVPFGSVASLDLSRYAGISCPEQKGSAVELINSGTGYMVRWIDGVAESKGSHTFRCTFDYVVDLPISRQPDTTLLIDVDYGRGVYDYIVTTSLVKDRYESRNLINDQYSANVSHFHDFAEIMSVTKITGDRYDSGKDYVDIDCPVGETSSCVISLKGDVPNDDSKRWAMYKIKYKTTGGQTGYVSFDIEITSSAMVFAYPGDYGVCNFGRGWEKENSTTYKTKLNGTSVNLPTCDASNSANPLLEFEGWVNFSNYDHDAPDFQVSSLCADYVVTSGGNYAHDPYKNIYMACYVPADGIILIPNGGKIPNSKNYIKKDDVIYVKKDGRIVLPEPTEIPTLYNLYGTGRFEGWSDVNGNIYSAGTAVEANGERYFATYSTGQTVAGEDVNQKMVYVNETSPYALNSTTIKSCVSLDTSKVVANISGGECFLTGVADTGEEYVDVLVKTTSSTRTLKVRVVSREGQFGDNWDTVIIDKDDNTGTENEDGYFENETGADICNSYKVSNDGQIVNDVATHGSFGLDVSRYKAVSKCGDGKEYLALCMDPGRPGPKSSDSYELDKTFNRANEFGKLVTHIVQKFVEGEKTDSNIAAANIALRIIEYYSPEELATSNNGGNGYLQNALDAYRVLAADLSKACPVLSSCTDSQVATALSKSWSWSNTTIRDKVAKYLVGYTGTAVDENREIKNEAKRTSSYEPGNDFLYHIKYEGTLTFPAGMTVNESDITTNCGSVPGVANCQVTGSFENASVYKYTFTYDIDLRNTGFYIPPSKSDVSPSIKITTTSGVTSANVFVIKTINDNKQRMVIFNTESVDLRVVMPIYVVCDINREPFVVGGPGFRDDLFKAAGCCQFLTDETSPEFITYCTADCIRSNFATVCNPNPSATGGGDSDVDVYTINEAYKASASGNKELNYACIVDVSNSTSAIDNTNSYHDDGGNYYALMSYHDNQYCSVSCKEDWDISTSAFRNFTAGNAVMAGQYFAVDQDLFIGGSRTCVTTYIDHAKYKNELTSLSEKITRAWTTQSEYSKVYSVLNASKTYVDQTYYTYKNNGPYCCGYDKDGNCTGTCYEWVVDTTNTCRVYSISTSAGGSYDTAIWNGQYATKGSSSISTNSLAGVGQGNGSKRETEWFAGSKPSSSSSTCVNCNGYCNTTQTADYLLDNVTYKGNNVKNTITTSRSTITSARSDIYEKAIDMTSCQNFVLKNTSTRKKNNFNYDSSSRVNKTYKGHSTISGFVGSSNAAFVDTKFEPSGTYTYEEREFMSLVGKDNVLEPHLELNNSTIEDAGKNPDTFNNDCAVLDTNRVRHDDTSLYLCKNKLDTLLYNTGSAWVPGSTEAKTYGENLSANKLENTGVSQFKITICDFSGSGYEYSSKGNCDWSRGLVSYYQANYIKQTLSNSSFYRNKGIWVTNTANDVKVHADDFEEGVSKLRVDRDYVSLFGAKHNTFPVGITTPRNMYQYSYTFGNIGYFSDGNTGRIMGNAATSLVAVNKHACFYEVIEDICRCCGDPILWEVYSKNNVEDTEEFLRKNGYDYQSSKTDYGDATKLSSRYGFTNSFVSLNGLDGDGDGKLSGIWSNGDSFTYQSKIYYTDKGAHLAGTIVKKGETVYDTKENIPEYSYKINPTAMSLIREYNGGHLYGYSAVDLIPYGISSKRTPMDANVTIVNKSNEDDINTFGHYGSKFLEQFMKSYETEEYKGKMLASRNTQGSGTVCSVAAGPDAAKQAYDLVQKNKCRWVDYIETTPDGKRIRLAFK